MTYTRRTSTAAWSSLRARAAYSAGVGIVAVILLATVSGVSAQPPRRETPSRDESSAALYAALARPVRFAVRDQPLNAALKQLGRVAGLPIRVAGLPDAVDGIGARARVRYAGKPAPPATILNRLLDKTDCAWTVADGEVLVTTAQRLWSTLPIRVYDASAWVGRRPPAVTQPKMRALVEVIKNKVTPERWSDVGGRCSITIADTTLVVSQTLRGHQAIQQLLARRNTGGRGAPAALNLADTSGLPVRRLLNRRVRLNYRQRPLTEVIAALDKLLEPAVVLDSQALRKGGIDPHTRVDLVADGITLRSAIRQALTPLDLGYVWQNGQLRVTTTDAAERLLTADVYPVADLLALTEDPTDAEWLLELIAAAVDPASWAEVGGSGRMRLSDGRLAVHQSLDAHFELERLLAACRLLQQRQASAGEAESKANDDPFGADDRSSRARALAPIPITFTDPRNLPGGERLAAPVRELDLDEVPLSDFVKLVTRQSGLQIRLDQRALDDVGLSADEKVSTRVRNVPLISVLRHVARELELVVTVRDEVITITTPEEAEARMPIRLYPVRDLVTLDGRLPAKLAHSLADEVLALVTSTLAPHSWEEVGGPGSIQVVPGIWALVVCQTEAVQDQLESLLGQLRAARQLARDWRPGRPLNPISINVSDREQTYLERLRAVGSIQVQEEPLDQLIGRISKAADIPLGIDRRALEDYGIGTDTPATAQLTGLSWGAALHHLLAEMELTLTVRDDMLRVTTRDEAESTLRTVIYPVPDLAFPTGRQTSSETAGRDPEIDRLLKADMDTPIDLITSLIAVDSWDDVGGPGSINGLPLAGALVVSQTLDVHDRLARFFDALREARTPADKKANSSRLLPGIRVGTAADRRIFAAAQRPAPELPPVMTIVELADQLQRRMGVTVRVHRSALEDLGFALDTRLPVQTGGENVAGSLERALKNHGLTWTVRRETLLLTSREDAEEQAVITMYRLPAALRARLQPSDLEAQLVEQVAPDSWDEVGGEGAVDFWSDPPILIVRQTESRHAAVLRWLKTK